MSFGCGCGAAAWITAVHSAWFHNVTTGELQIVRNSEGCWIRVNRRLLEDPSNGVCGAKASSIYFLECRLHYK